MATVVSSQEREQIRQAFAKATMETHAGPGAESSALGFAGGASAGELKETFCKNWDTVKTVLTFLKSEVGGLPGTVIGIVISAGDSLHNDTSFCPTK